MDNPKIIFKNQHRENTLCALNGGQELSPCTIVIFGASGDLTARKLIPALFNLYKNDRLPEPLTIIGAARTEMTRQEFANRLKESMAPAQIDLKRWDEFCQNLYYQEVDYDSPHSFTVLADFLTDLDTQRKTKGNRIFYLAIPPSLYPTVADHIGQAGLANEGVQGKQWSRIVVEKPFGRDLKTAIELDTVLHKSFKEEQIYRIDHYLAKETIQNILMFRFANYIFEPLWNRNFIDYIGIIAAEKLGIEHRAGYYEQAGVLRDMFQNHMKQLLALTAMEAPSLFQDARVQDEKTKVFRSLKPLTEGNLFKDLILGQYSSGTIDRHKVPAYRNEPGVNASSATPTFALMRLFIDNWRWKHVPFYLVSGKRLREKITRIVVQFKKVPHSMFRHVLGEDISANRLIIGIYPHEKISLTFQTKTPGARLCLQPATMDFTYQSLGPGATPDAYEKVLLDCIQGDHMLFWRQDGVELTWAFLTPILEECESCRDLAGQLHPYPAGSWGPKTAMKWLKPIIS
ncbi:MAG: glucose-6-phosphate dehydrogenase [Proteobacteria bacterium]|nr:glucose-6-phosphate dehydrogenase [Pseudomonadota bacterium]MBU1714086.1 glucose-6-phosphate dehydrogenase [Pseudomonadota bacterium]